MRKPREIKYEWWVKLYKCSSCWEFLPRDRFNKNLSWYDFISSECKKCCNARTKKYRQENKEKRNAYQKDYKAKRMLMYEEQFWDWTNKKPENITITSKMEDITLTPSINRWEPVITKEPAENFTFSSNFARAEKMRQENLEAAWDPDERTDDEIVVQAAIDKFPDAYTEILSDEDLVDVFNNVWSVDTKISELKKRQERIDKEKEEKEYNAAKDKMRDLVDATLDDKQKRDFEDKLHSLHEKHQDDFIKKVSRLSKASFPALRNEIFEAILDIQTWKSKPTLSI